MSLSEADNTPETSSVSFENSEESQEVRGISQSYFLESFGGTHEKSPPRIPQAHIAETNDRRASRNQDDNNSMSTVSTAILLEGSSSSGNNEYYTAEEVEPNIEEAMQFLKQEAAAAKPRISYVRTSLDGGFEAHEYKLPRKISQSSLEPEGAGRTKAPYSPSLLSNILVSSPQEPAAKTIPALRAVSGSHQKQKTWEARRQSVASVVKLQSAALQPPERARIAKLTDSQMDLTLCTLQEYQKDLEATAGRGTDTHSSGLPVQHIDSSSIRSFDSQHHTFLDIYSITRIAALIGVCLLVPPLFFMIASGKRGGGVSNYRLMRLIMNSKHRVGLMKGFVWEVDVGWFRYLCLSLGVLETLVIMAGIGCGIGIGIHRES